MPKKGYASLTLPSWVIDILKDECAIGQTPQSIVINLLYRHVGKKELEQKQSEWRKKFGTH